jgi:biotin operon repressor
VNTVCYRNYRTIEFRQHSGSVNASKISNWVQFLQQFIAYSVATTPRVQNSIQETVTHTVTPVARNHAGTPTPWAQANRNWNYRLAYGHTKIQNYLLQNVNQYVTVSQIASYARMNEQSVPSYISAIRNAWGVTIKNSRSRGYMLVWSPTGTTNTVTEQPVNRTEVISTPTHNVISDSLWDGIHENLRSYYEERTMELA